MAGGAEPAIPGGAVDDALRREGLRWVREGDHLVKRWCGTDFESAIAFTNRVAALAAAFDHHPDIDIRYNCVTLRLTTHESAGLTSKDLRLAGVIDAMAGLGDSKEVET